MKKKIPLIICAVVVAAAVVAMVIFALGGKDEAPVNEIDIKGTWKVAAYFSDGAPSIIDNEFMVFDDENASDYRDGAAEPFAVSTYTLDNAAMELSLPGLSRKYTVEKLTDNYIRLYEHEGVYMELFRYMNDDMSPLSFDSASFEGKWNIIYRRTDKPYAGDYMVFENGTASQYSGGGADPVATSPYSWKDGNCLVVDKWAKELVIYPLSDTRVIMVELGTDTGFIWEFERAD